MDEVTISRRYSKPPNEVWPTLSRLDDWLESELRWRLDERETDAPQRLVARLWDPADADRSGIRPAPSTKVTITIEPDGQGSIVTIVEQRDRNFSIDGSSTTGNGRVSALAGR